QEIRRRSRLEQHAPGEVNSGEIPVVRGCGRGEGLLPPGSPIRVGVRVDIEGPYVPGSIPEAEVFVSGRERRSSCRARQEMPAVEELFICAVRELCLTRRFRGEVQIPVPPGLQVILRSHATGERGKLRAQIAQDLRLRTRARVRRSAARGLSRRRGSPGIGFLLAARG